MQVHRRLQSLRSRAQPLFCSNGSFHSENAVLPCVVLNKHTGARGKGGSNDANAEYIAKLRHVFDENKVAFQLTEMGKIDAGGGGTIAYILANFGMEVIDGGVAVLSMHSPWEVSSKADVYEAYRGYCAFLKDMK